MREQILTELKLTLGCDELLNLNKIKLLQGVTMENINTMYAKRTKRQNWKPYSQSLSIDGDKVIWDIKALSTEAYNDVIVPLLDKKFKINEDRLSVSIYDKELKSISKESLYNECYSNDTGRIYKIEFQSPTAFRIDGKNHNFPDVKSIYRNLIRRYEAISEVDVSVYNDVSNKELLAELVENTNIVAFDVQSTNYTVRGIRIPSFTGSITIKINGDKKIVNMARWLLAFGEYSGVGINTSKGMGCIKITDGKKKNRT